MSALFIPTLSHWLLGNRWSGSLGRASYYVTPRQRQEGEQTVDEVYAEAWTGPICYEQCTPERTAAFPVTEEGLAQLRTLPRSTRLPGRADDRPDQKALRGAEPSSLPFSMFRMTAS